MIDQKEEERDKELEELKGGENMELEKEDETEEVEVEHRNRKKRRIELYQLEEIIADSEENIRRIIGTDCP